MAFLVLNHLACNKLNKVKAPELNLETQLVSGQDKISNIEFVILETTNESVFTECSKRNHCDNFEIGRYEILSNNWLTINLMRIIHVVILRKNTCLNT